MELCRDYYTNYCPVGTPGKQEAIDEIDGALPVCSDDTVTATWDPTACPEPNTDSCLVSEATQLAIDFVIENKDNTDTSDVCM